MGPVATTLLISGSVAVGACVAVSAGYYVYRRRKKQPAPSGAPARTDAARDEFTREAKAFQGIYEPMHQLAGGRLRNKRNVFGDWDVRVSHLKQAPAFQALWQERFGGWNAWADEEYIVKASELMALVRGYGVARATKTQLTIEEDTYTFYAAAGGDIIERGKQAKVVWPCWTLNGNVVERGLLEHEQETGRETNDGEV